MIQRGESEVYDRQSRRVTIHLIKLDNTQHRVVYDKERKQVVTILPKEIL